MLHVPDDSVVVLVDFQTRLMPVIHEGSSVVTQAVRLARIAQILGVPVMGTEQAPSSWAGTYRRSRSCARTPSSRTISTRARRAFEALPDGRNSVIVAGCEAHVCVLQTALGLLRSGRKVTVVSDAVGSRRTIDRDAGIARLGAAGVQIATVEMIGFEWLGSSRHPRFREVLRLIK